MGEQKNIEGISDYFSQSIFNNCFFSIEFNVWILRHTSIRTFARYKRTHFR